MTGAPSIAFVSLGVSLGAVIWADSATPDACIKRRAAPRGKRLAAWFGSSQVWVCLIAYQHSWACCLHPLAATAGDMHAHPTGAAGHPEAQGSARALQQARTLGAQACGPWMQCNNPVQ